jgi:hypothetical protein
VASGRVSYEFRHFVRDGLDLTLGLLTRCGQPETYFALTEQVFANQKSLFEALKGRDAQMQAAMSAPAAQRFLAKRCRTTVLSKDGSVLSYEAQAADGAARLVVTLDLGEHPTARIDTDSGETLFTYPQGR